MKQLLSSLLIILVSAASCNKAKEVYFINFELPYEQTVKVPQVQQASKTLSSGGSTVLFPAYAVPTGIQAALEQYNAKRERVVSASLLLLSLQIATPTSYNFNYLDSVQLYVSARDLPEQLIAYDYDVPKNIKILDLHKVPGLNLKDYIIQDTIYFRIKTHVNTATPDNAQLRLKSIFHVEANPVI